MEDMEAMVDTVDMELELVERCEEVAGGVEGEGVGRTDMSSVSQLSTSVF